MCFFMVFEKGNAPNMQNNTNQLDYTVQQDIIVLNFIISEYITWTVQLLL